MASKHQLTGMAGVYLVASELSRRGFIVSPTSRGAQGADLLVTDTDCSRSYAVQVKTNATTFTFWLLGAKNLTMHSRTFLYAFVNFRSKGTEIFIVPSKFVTKHIEVSKPSKTRASVWYGIRRSVVEKYRDRWSVFDK